MSSDREQTEPERDPDLYDEEAGRSIFSAMWFRAVLVVLVIGVIGVVAVPYLLDVVNPPVKPSPMKSVTRPSAPPAPALAPTSPSPTSPAPAPPAATTATAPAPPAGTPATTATAPPPAAKAPAATAAPATPTPVAPAPAAVAKAPEPARADATKPAAPKAGATRAAAKAPAASGGKTATTAVATGQYYVQVGAFSDAAKAKRVAAALREQNYRVTESVVQRGASAARAPAPAPAAPPAATAAGDRYDVFISGTSPGDITGKVSAKGLAAESVAGGVVVKPSLPLRDAVALSKDLAADGLKVQVRRSGPANASAPTAPAPAPVAADGGVTLYRVRVGGYADRAGAQTALKELEARGYKPFIARGSE